MDEWKFRWMQERRAREIAEAKVEQLLGEVEDAKHAGRCSGLRVVRLVLAKKLDELTARRVFAALEDLEATLTRGPTGATRNKP